MPFDYKLFFEEKGFKAFNYIIDVENLSSVLNEKGILSRNQVKSKKIGIKDISTSKYQKRRKDFVREGINEDAHDFVPLHFATHTAMLYIVCINKGLRSDIAIIKLSTDLIENAKYFTDKNCAGQGANYYTNLEDLPRLNWDVILNERPTQKEPVKKKQKQAEILIPNIVPLSYIDEIILHSSNKKIEKIESMFDKHDIIVKSDDNEFY